MFGTQGPTDLSTLSLQFVNCKPFTHRAICERASVTCPLVMLWLPAAVSRGFWSWSLTTAKPSRRWVGLSLTAWSDNLDMIIHYQISFGQASANKVKMLSGLRGDQLELLLILTEKARRQVLSYSQNYCGLHWPGFTSTKHGKEERPVLAVKQLIDYYRSGTSSLNTTNSFVRWRMQNPSLNMREWQRSDLRRETSGW